MRILILSENKNIRKNIRLALSNNGRSIIEAGSAEDIISSIEGNHINLIVLDYKPELFPDELIKKIKLKFPRILFIMIASSNGLEEGMNILQHEPFFYTIHPVNLNELQTIAGAALEKINFAEKIYREV